MSQPVSFPPLADPAALVRAMSRVHRRLAADLAERAADPRVEPSLREAHARDAAEGRTGEAYEVYREGFCDQVAASWVLCAVFARTLEDRGYLPHRLAGPGAADRLAQFRAQMKFLGERDYLLHVFDAIALMPGGRGVFGPGRAPLWRLGPSSRAIGELLDELRATDGGALRFTFGRPAGDEEEHDGASTRYLGDLYQDLNEGVRKRYALLQTPEFVERFLLENTLDPAIRERGVAVTVLDPACGSGHLLLGAYDRLFEARRRVEPGKGREESARAALGQVYGVDLNPYAAAIARFRLLLSYLDKAGIPKLEQVPEEVEIHVHVGDSLLAGREVQGTFGDALARQGVATEGTGFERGPLLSFFEPETDRLLASTRFDVVVANPPYITEKDAKKRELIRERYVAASGKYALSAPFVERIFQLGNEGAFTGQITANSFMKREFGKRLIEDVLPRIDLTEVIDTSSAYIPGHGTPTVILFGRARRRIGSQVRVVMGSRGEPTTPSVPSEGKVWSSIASHHLEAGYGNEYISVADVERDKLGHHPWSLGGGGATELKELLETRAEKRLGEVVDIIGVGALTMEDDAYIWGEGAIRRHEIPAVCARPMVTGDVVRDWAVHGPEHCVFPYDQSFVPWPQPAMCRALWPLRTSLQNRYTYGKTHLEHGRFWYEFSIFFPARFRVPLSIIFAFVATHNHFVFDRGGSVFNRTAQLIKLPEGATEEEHLALLGYLNSSTACFWMKQVCTKKGEGGGSRVAGGFSIMGTEEWKNNFEFSGTALLEMPVLPVGTLLPWASALDEQSKRAADLAPRHVFASLVERDDGASALLQLLALTRREFERCRSLACALQEELDWLVYALLGLPSPPSCVTPDTICELVPEGRPVEVALAERVRQGESTEWYERFRRGALRLEDLNSLAPMQARVVRQRLSCTSENKELQLLERLEYKRRWEPLDWDGEVHDACESWLLTRAESALRDRPDPRPLPIRALAAVLHADPKVRAVAEVLTGTSTYDLEAVLADLVQKESVPSATCQRYTEEGIAKRRLWERTWELQRREDAGEKLDVPVPPKYDQKDFENAAVVWRHRGKLDVPKERFVAYPTATPPSGASGKASLVFGWAGWNHLEQLQAAIELWQEEMGLHGHELIPRATRLDREEALGAAAATDEGLLLDAAARERLLPLLQTMADLLPWVRQWHDEDGETAAAFEAYLAEQARRLEVSLDEARAYRRPARAGARGRKPAPERAAAAEPRAPARAARPARGASADEAALDAFVEAVRARDEGAGVAAADLGQQLGLSASALKKTVDALVEAGRLVEKKKRPRVVASTAGRAGGGEDVEA
ncbi:BREX-2 system adenine-specific DNA-methyltransferase PglX [Sorangium sp. So ce394]|uniref:BREX-2 system adenine-specific DNA-methyltransferase PglX n=1 Tax=Sorangium sp. So ce394 TaxID=3133310 RepID=UPI003F5CA9A6